MVAVAGTKPLLLERDAELARLGALLEQAHAGSGSVVTITGPAGIGKTELLAAVHRIARERGFRALRARGRELEADMAFSVVRQLLEQPVLSASPSERRRLLCGPARPGAGALGLAAGDSPASEFAAVHGLYWLCVNLADRKPLLLTVDDLQWVDRPSLSWLGPVRARRHRSCPLPAPRSPGSYAGRHPSQAGPAGAALSWSARPANWPRHSCPGRPRRR